jgi:hypothetical protein
MQQETLSLLMTGISYWLQLDDQVLKFMQDMQ